MKGKYRKRNLCNRKGNITVEASFLFPILFVLIIMLIFLMFFCYNKVTVWKNTYYAGIKMVEAKREGTVYNLEQEWERISKQTLIFPENIKVKTKNVADGITVIGKIEFNIPFWGKVEIQEKSVLPLCRNRETIARYKLWKE